MSVEGIMSCFTFAEVSQYEGSFNMYIVNTVIQYMCRCTIAPEWKNGIRIKTPSLGCCHSAVENCTILWQLLLSAIHMNGFVMTSATMDMLQTAVQSFTNPPKTQQDTSFRESSSWLYSKSDLWFMLVHAGQ